MKIRIKGNSLRLRLTQSEINLLAEKQAVRETTTFPGEEVLSYALKVADVPSITAALQGHGIEVHLPQAMAKDWIETDRVGLQEEVGGLKILVEKDFACLIKRDGEDDADAYPNPLSEKR